MAKVPMSRVKAYRQHLGANIRRARINMEVSQSFVAERAGVTVPMISHFELGRNAPNLRMLLTLADILGVEVSALFHG